MGRNVVMAAPFSELVVEIFAVPFCEDQRQPVMVAGANVSNHLLGTCSEMSSPLIVMLGKPQRLPRSVPTMFKTQGTGI